MTIFHKHDEMLKISKRFLMNLISIKMEGFHERKTNFSNQLLEIFVHIMGSYNGSKARIPNTVFVRFSHFYFKMMLNNKSSWKHQFENHFGFQPETLQVRNEPHKYVRKSLLSNKSKGNYFVLPTFWSKSNGGNNYQANGFDQSHGIETYFSRILWNDGKYYQLLWPWV